MHNFFKGWRRKAGSLLLLATASVFCLWMRSHVRFDEVAIPGRDSEHYLKSEAGQLCWSRLDESRSVDSIRWRSQDASDGQSIEFWADDDSLWSWPAGGFTFGATDGKVRVSSRLTDMDEMIFFMHRCTFRVIPHWSVVLILTLFAGRLILWKPKTMPAPEPSASSLIPNP